MSGPPHPPGEPTVAPDGAARNVVVDCGWGRLVFGNTFPDAAQAAEALRAEVAGARDICVYLPEPHVLVAQHHDEFFIDPSHMYRLELPAPTPAHVAEAPPVRPLRGARDADAVNRIYSANGMLVAPVDTLVSNAHNRVFLHLVATHPATGEVIGTITGVDHAHAWGDPRAGASLWCLAVDMNQAPPGTGRGLIGALADALTTRGRPHLDLSVLAENSGAIRLYERLGFSRLPDLCVKRKNPLNENLFVAEPERYEALNPYARIIADEARRRGIRVEVIDPEWGELRLVHGGRSIVTRESLSELTNALALSRCDDKRITRRVLARAGLPVPRAIEARAPDRNREFLARVGEVVVKPARGEQGHGISVGVRDPAALGDAVERARKHCPDVLIEECHRGEDLRVIMIDHEVVAAAVRRPASVTGDGQHTVRELIERQSRRRAGATDGESRIPLDAITRTVVEEAGHRLDEVLAEGTELAVRRTANLHTGGTIHDVTATLHPTVIEACVAASRALAIPVTGLDLLVPDPSGPQHVFIEANERPGLANHEPQPTAEHFIDLLFPNTRPLPRLWEPTEPERALGSAP